MSIEPVAPSGWTDARMFALKCMWADGDSAKQIAEALGNVTRNAVLGKIHRLGLADTAPKKKPHGFGGPRPVLTREQKAQRQAARAFERKTVCPTPLPEPTPPPPSFLNLTFDQLQYGDCRFPSGYAPPYLFCGNPTVNGTSWCQTCFAFTHAPPPIRRDRRPFR